MSKHNKQNRKEYLKRRRRQLKEKKNATELSSEIRQETSEQIQLDEAPVSPDSSQAINVNTEYVQASRILNTNDPEVIKRFLKPCKDPLYVAFWKYQANKMKLLHLVGNPLTS